MLIISYYFYVNHKVKCKTIYNYVIILTVSDSTYGRNVIFVTTNLYINQYIGEILSPT